MNVSAVLYKRKMKNKTSNHNMSIPTVLYLELQSIANEKATTVSEIMKMLIKTGLCVYNINKTKGGEVIVRTEAGGPQRNLLI